LDEKRPYEALLVDYGGVLTTSMSASFAEFCLATGVHPERLKLVLAPAYRVDSRENPDREDLDDLVAAVETGRMPVAEFNRRLATVLSEGLEQPVDALDLATKLFRGAAPDDRMIEAVREAKSQGVKTGLVSNTWGLRDLSPWSDDLFDTVVLSGREGLRKPDPGDLPDRGGSSRRASNRVRVRRRHRGKRRRRPSDRHDGRAPSASRHHHPEAGGASGDQAQPAIAPGVTEADRPETGVVTTGGSRVLAAGQSASRGHRPQ